MNPRDLRVIAVDWSGDQSRPQKKIWLAEVNGGHLARLERGRTREEITEHLVTEVTWSPNLVVGLDFAFSFPAWFCNLLGAATSREVWRKAAELGEEWLSDCPEPFWGKPGKKKPDLPSYYRETEVATAAETGFQPKSVFQIAGGGAVGSGSIRGMPHLLTLVENGFSVFPFMRVRLPLVLEIYPRVLTGGVVKSNSAARAAFLEEGFPEIPEELRDSAAGSEDAFDAAVSAVVMTRHLHEILTLTQPEGERARTEGVIWRPAGGPMALPVESPDGDGTGGEEGREGQASI